jgi:hypothetical protein
VNRVPPFLRWLTAGIASVAILTALFVAKGEGQREGIPAVVTATANPTNGNAKLLRLMVVVTDEKGATTGVAIISRTSDSKTLRIYNLDPSSVIDLGDQGLRPLSETTQETFVDPLQSGVEAATGIPLDGTLRLQRLPLAGLIDSVGGITITSPQGFLVSGLDENPVYVPDGTNHVTGAQAADFATFAEVGAPESDRIGRLNQVLAAIFQALPTDEKRLNETIEALGAMVTTSVPTADVVSMLIDLNEQNEWPLAVARTLPTSPSDLEQSVASKWLRVERTQTAPIGEAMESSLYAGKPIVHIVQVTGGLAASRISLRDSLVQNGFAFVDGGNPGLAAQTSISVSSDLNKADIQKVLNALTMSPLWESRVAMTENPIADVLVTLGTDFIFVN